MTTVAYPHIAFKQNGTPIIESTHIRVDLVVQAFQEGVTAEQLAADYPPLTLGQVYSALAYYYDHKHEMDQKIAEAQRFVEEMRLTHDSGSALLARLRRGELDARLEGHPELRDRLREQGLIP
jgi:uncharacterized protein (DUF433 family)